MAHASEAEAYLAFEDVSLGAGLATEALAVEETAGSLAAVLTVAPLVGAALLAGAGIGLLIYSLAKKEDEVKTNDKHDLMIPGEYSSTRPRFREELYVLPPTFPKALLNFSSVWGSNI